MEQWIKGNLVIGENIKSLRMRHKMTQSDVTTKMQLAGCNIMRGTYAKIESGIRHISLEELKAISYALESDYNTLLGYQGSKNEVK